MIYSIISTYNKLVTKRDLSLNKPLFIRKVLADEAHLAEGPSSRLQCNSNNNNNTDDEQSTSWKIIN